MDISLERYKKETRWVNKVRIMAIYHEIQKLKSRKWTITDTARHFGVSIGLTSENLRIYKEGDKNSEVFDCITREDALRKIK